MVFQLRTIEMPKKVVMDEAGATDTYAKFTAEPFERGFGATVGNSLRRILLSSLEGAAVSSIRIEGVDHEFSTLPGVYEDLAQIIMNIKLMVLRSHSKEPKSLTLDIEKKGEVLASEFSGDATLEVVNRDFVIATLTKKTRFKAEFTVTKGRGFVTAEGNRNDEMPIGTIPIDSVYSPVIKVAFKVEDTRVGQITDYDRLILEIWTNGSIHPKDALTQAAAIHQQQSDVFVSMGRLAEEHGDLPKSVIPLADDDLYRKFAQPVTELELSVRSANCLSEARIKTIGDLVSRSEGEMLKYRNFGKKSLNEIAELLRKMELHLGMEVDLKKLALYTGTEAA